MTEKTLDEQVFECFDINATLDIFQSEEYAKDLTKKGFFTESIANCKKYIEPGLLGLGRGLKITYIECFQDWNVESRLFLSDGKMFKGIGKTESIAYCNALLDLKERKECPTS